MQIFFLNSFSHEVLLALVILKVQLVQILVRFVHYVHIFTYKYLLEAVYFLLSKFFKTFAVVGLWAMPSPRLELGASPLPRECSTAELQGQF